MSSAVYGRVTWMPDAVYRGVFGVLLADDAWAALGAQVGDRVVVEERGNTFAAEVARFADQRFVRVFADRELGKGRHNVIVRLARAR